MSEIFVGLDIGTSTIRVVVAERVETGVLQVIGVGVGESNGLRKGAVVNIENTVSGIHQAIEAAEMMSGVEITHCVVGIGGTHIEGINSKGIVAVTDKGKGNREIDEKDIERVVDAARAVAIPIDRRVLHVIPKSYKVDDQPGIKDPRNMIGVRIEGEVHIVTGSVTCMKNIVDCVKRSNIQVDDLMYHGLAAVKSVLNEEERNLGSVLIDIGGGTTDFVVMHEGAPVFVGSIPVGGIQVSSDLAQIKNLSFETAENIKIKDGCCWVPLIEDDGKILISGQASRAPIEIEKREIAEIMEARMSEVFTIVYDKIKRGSSGLRTADSIILCGGGSLLPGVVELASAIFGTPAVHLGMPGTLGGLTGEYRSPEFAVVLGLLLEQVQKRGASAAQGKTQPNQNGLFTKAKDLWKSLF
ncbi:cell division protein FtsA [Treponema phagedenis]|uniref:Cell division protein FtsA n=1 Tax=Treponema phagedenis TaxID=162 RepID=A0A0B7GTF3_TREPH|nr:cell division protein FtsA [Treponema phagedenis]EFW39272.1 cell division protein FtsA [Treponema phagedenis F0421]NVP24559.1 cell division protein FtsA [Treponema phagedenis]QEJ94743.1 cell division protein FtsA [Treponema phagedenis]QEJ97680.1 cell division protein FtsA [Treponema phagedenis]QEK00649.1 cell division protein FtsA [Treponema phagedenis]